MKRQGTSAAALPDSRRKLIAAVHIAKKEMALEDASYRALLERVGGASSSADMGEPQLQAVLTEFERLGWRGSKAKRVGRRGRAQASSPQATKARALWLNLWNLGELRSSDEAALSAFLKRQCGVEALQWASPRQMNLAIEGLKAWCERAGVAVLDAARGETLMAARATAGLTAERDPAHRTTGEAIAWKSAMVAAQWQKLIDLGVMAAGQSARLDTWLVRNHGATAPWFLTPAAADQAIAELGRWIRRVKAKQEATDG